MKRVDFMRPQRYRSAGSQTNPNVLHIEVPGAIINVTIGLHDAEGREVTHVSVQCDPGWQVPPADGAAKRLRPLANPEVDVHATRSGVGVRVRKESAS